MAVFSEVDEVVAWFTVQVVLHNRQVLQDWFRVDAFTPLAHFWFRGDFRKPFVQVQGILLDVGQV